MVVRSYEEECAYLEKLTSHSWRIKKGFQPNMNVEGIFYVNEKLEKLMFDELKNACRPGMIGGFLPGNYLETRIQDETVNDNASFKVSNKSQTWQRYPVSLANPWAFRIYTQDTALPSGIWPLLTWEMTMPLSVPGALDLTSTVGFD